MKIKLIISIIIILICIVIFFVFIKEPSFEKKLKNLGYNDKEIQLISKNVGTMNCDTVIDLGKNDSLIYIISNKEYKDKNLKKYLDYISDNKKAPIDDVIDIVNSGYDILDIKYSKLLADLIREKYFIFDNLDRYLDYSKTNNYSSNEIVTNVNSNLDKVWYQDTEKSNIKDDDFIIVNKIYYLEEDYQPTDLVTLDSKYNNGKCDELRRDAANAFMKMVDAAMLDNITLKNVSGYRDYSYQENLYNSYVSRDGKDAADTYSARAGFSEHQTGLATDINEASSSFENTDAFKWLSNNAYKYGFILRYPKDKEYITGYQYEAWHYRYVGKKAAKIIKNENITFEEYYAYYVKQESK